MSRDFSAKLRTPQKWGVRYSPKFKTVNNNTPSCYEKLRSVEQKLSFDSAKTEFAKRKVKFGDSQMAILVLMNTDKIFTNLALLLSEQCIHTIKVAIFQDTTPQVFKDRQEFEGSLFKQINEVYWISCKTTFSVIPGLTTMFNFL